VTSVGTKRPLRDASSPDTDVRIYRVANLRADEVEHLNREAGNRSTKPCCPHLDVFHTGRTNEDGSSWRVCNVWGCPCHEEEPASPGMKAIAAEEAKLARDQRRDAVIGAFVLGAALAVGVMYLFGCVS
jgi:hypothetical protein